MGFLRFLGLAAQLGLVLGLFFLYNIELERGFGTVAVLTFGGFLIHTWLPLRLRLPFFLSITALAIALLLGADGLYLVALGLGLLLLCHVPGGWWVRFSALTVVAAVLVALQAGWIDAPWGGAVIPVLGAMFMFRIVLYVYDLRTERTPAGFWQRVGYFFLLPNVCFPLFPVIDYRTFLQTYYDAEATEIYQKGVFWMFRGTVHLLLYRILYQLLPRAEADLPGVLGVYVFMAMTYGLYLRVSGLFHLITGSLALFGFNLPRTNNNYFLASSFNDLWRRINIYWKDFMMNVVFYPTFMSVRSWAMAPRLVIATGTVFFVTWFLHSYQWFWLLGSFPVTITDIAFWGLLGVALAINSVRESRHGRRRQLGEREWSFRLAALQAVKVLGVFSTMAILWSLWASESFSEWGYRVLRIGQSGLSDWLLLGALLFTILALGVVGQWLGSRNLGWGRMEEFGRIHAAKVIPTVAVGLGFLGLPAVYGNMGDQLPRLIVAAKSPEPNLIDLERQERSYYEALSRTTELGPQEGHWESFQYTPGARQTGDIRGITIAPDVEMLFKGAEFHSNRWGMRDRDYELVKPPGSRRFAILGSSQVMGSGVEDTETFENIVENRLNEEADGSRFELLNFAIPGHGLIQSTFVAENVVPRFSPDIVLYFIHPGESRRAIERIRWAQQLDGRIGPEYGYLSDILRRVEARPDLPVSEFTHRLEPHREEIVEWAYARQVAAIRALGARPVFVFLPVVGREFTEQELERLERMATTAGAATIALTGVFDGVDADRLKVAEWDDHPNARAHRMIAAALYDALTKEEFVSNSD